MSKIIRYAIAMSLCIVLVLGMSAYAFADGSRDGDRERDCDRSSKCQYGGGDHDDGHDDDDHHDDRDKDRH